MAVTATQVLNVARSQIGYHEGPNNDNKYGVWYGWNDVSWCDIFQSWLFAQVGAASLIGGKFAYCPFHIDWFKANGRWSGTPAVGALVFYDWNGDGVSDHVGIVESYDNDFLTVIEGNTGNPNDNIGRYDGVYRRRRSRHQFIVGYGVPAYGTPISNPVPLPPITPVTFTTPLVVDGVWGPKTTTKLQSFLRVAPVDGAFGPITCRALQRWVGCAQDGVFGPVTKKHLQAKLNVAQDGIIGPITVKALQRFLNRN